MGLGSVLRMCTRTFWVPRVVRASMLGKDGARRAHVHAHLSGPDGAIEKNACQLGVILAYVGAILGHLGAILGHLGAILGQS